MRRKIRVTYDVRMLGHSGIGTQVENVVRRLAARPDIHLTLIGDPDKIRAFVPAFDGILRPWTAPIYSLREQLTYPKPEQGDILLLPHYNAPIRYIGNAVVVLHDLIHLHSTEFRAPHYRLYAETVLRQVANRARRIMTVSQFTKEDFLSRFPRAAARTVANPNGIDHDLFQPQSRNAINGFRAKYGLPARFLLCVGIGKRHKNVDFVIRALLPQWRSGSLALPLVIGGSGGALPPYVTETFPPGGLSEVQVLPTLPQAELPLLYGAAEALIMPSLMEGFGFPVAEAMACGSPVICSNAASLPEVGGKAALYFDPKDALSFTDQVFKVVGGANVRARLASAGVKQAARFRWEKHVECLVQVLSELDNSR